MVNNLNISNLTDIIAIFVATAALIMSIVFSLLQQKHNRNSVRPIASIVFYDYENFIAVKIKNNGIGPLIITNTVFRNMINEENAANLLALMPRINQSWSGFTTEIKNTVLAVKDEIDLISLRPANTEIRKQVRKALSDVYIEIAYEDIYGTQFMSKRACDFFGRSL